MTIKELTLEEKIYVAMKRKGYTYEKLAGELGLSIGYVHDIVKGNRKGEQHMEKILNILEIEGESEC